MTGLIRPVTTIGALLETAGPTVSHWRDNTDVCPAEVGDLVFVAFRLLTNQNATITETMMVVRAEAITRPPIIGILRLFSILCFGLSFQGFLAHFVPKT